VEPVKPLSHFPSLINCCGPVALATLLGNACIGILTILTQKHIKEFMID